MAGTIVLTTAGAWEVLPLSLDIDTPGALTSLGQTISTSMTIGATISAPGALTVAGQAVTVDDGDTPELMVLDSFEDNTLYAPPSAYTSTFDWAGAVTGDVSISTTYAKTGSRSKRFRWTTSTDSSEHYFNYDVVPELWVSYWLRVPDNYSHGVSGGNNNKLMMFFMDDYSFHGDGSTVGMEMRPDGGGSSYWYVKVSPGNYTVLGSDQGSSRFITVPDDRGKWMQIVFNAKPETSEGESDGHVKVWRKWDGDESFTAVYNFTGQPVRIPEAGPEGFTGGYIMGWCNGRYAATTDFYIDDFTISAGDPLEGLG